MAFFICIPLKLAAGQKIETTLAGLLAAARSAFISTES